MGRVFDRAFPYMLFSLAAICLVLLVTATERCDSAVRSPDYQAPAQLVRHDFATFCYRTQGWRVLQQ